MTAAPNDRAGFMEQLVMGIAIRCAKKTERPIASGARLPATESLYTAVISTVRHSMNVPTNSTTKAGPHMRVFV